MSWAFLITALIVVIIPGTGVLYTVATGLGQGRLASVAAAIGCTLGIVPHLLASVLGLAAILHASALVFQVFKYAGAAYLIYLAWQTLRERGPLSFDRTGAHKSLAKLARTGFLINILNPKLSIFFLAFLPQFVPVGAQSSLPYMIGLGGVFMALTFVVFIAYGQFEAWARTRLFESDRVMAWMRRVTGVVLGGLGVRLAFSQA